MDQVAQVMGWLESSFFLVTGAGGVVLVLLGLKRDDVVRPIFLLAGVLLAAAGFGVHFLGWRI